MKIKTRLKMVCAATWIITAVLCGTVNATVIDKIVAIVNSDIITLVELNKEAGPYLDRIEKAGYPPEKKEEMAGQIRADLLNVLIDRSLTQQEAKRYSISVSEGEVDAAVENFKSSRGISQAELEAGLAKEGMTMAAYRETAKKQILQSKLINHAVKSKVVITDMDVKTFYDTHSKDFAGTKKYHLRNILNTDESLMTELHQKLKQGGEFSGLARVSSMAPNASDGGDLGMFDISNFSEEIKKQISHLKKNQFTDIISTAQGFQIFYVEDILIDGNKTLEQARDEIYERLYREQVETKFKTWLESLKEQAHIVIKL